MFKRLLFFTYGVASYLVFLATFLYASGDRETRRSSTVNFSCGCTNSGWHQVLGLVVSRDEPIAELAHNSRFQTTRCASRWGEDCA